jgi:hypothetical protein
LPEKPLKCLGESLLIGALLIQIEFFPRLQGVESNKPSKRSKPSMEIEMQKSMSIGLVTFAMFMFTALARADGPVFHILDGRCGVFDAAGYIWVVEGLHVTSSTDPNGNTSLHCNASLPEGAAIPSGKPVVWEADSVLPDPALVPDGAFNATEDPDDGLIYCGIAGAGVTTEWHNIVTKSGKSNASCTFHPE